MGQSGVTTPPPGAEGEGGEPGQAAGHEQQVGAGDVGAVAEAEGGEGQAVGGQPAQAPVWHVLVQREVDGPARAGRRRPSMLDTMWSVRFEHPHRLREVMVAASDLVPATSAPAHQRTSAWKCS